MDRFGMHKNYMGTVKDAKRISEKIVKEDYRMEKLNKKIRVIFESRYGTCFLPSAKADITFPFYIIYFVFSLIKYVSKTYIF